MLIILKIGTSTLTRGTSEISRAKIEDIARQIVELQKKHQVVIVSSGAIATAKQFVKLKNQQTSIDDKQALAAIGQPILMKIYAEVFADFGLNIAQCLFTYTDFKSERSRENMTKTLHKLIDMNYIPIINENDSIAVEEIVVGDNDKLSALVAEVLGADRLVICSDIKGLYDRNPAKHADAILIEEITDLEKVREFGEGSDGKLGTGGMVTKLDAAEICMRSGIEMWIVSAREERFVLDAMEGKVKFSKFG